MNSAVHFVNQYMLKWTEQLQRAVDSIYGNKNWYSGAFLKTTNKYDFERYLQQKPYYPGQYLEDLGISSENEVADLKDQDWSSVIIRREEMVSEYYQDTFWSTTLKKIILYGGGVIIVIIGIICILMPCMCSVEKDNYTYELLGLRKRTIYCRQMIFIIILLMILYIFSMLVYKYYIVNSVFADIVIPLRFINKVMIYSVILDIILCFIYLLMLINRKKWISNDYYNKKLY